MNTNNGSVCFTGHRQIETAEYDLVVTTLENIIIELIKKGYRYFRCGGALGLDTVAAQIILKLKKVYPDIKLQLVLPCLNQTRGWKESDVLIYEQIKAAADEVTYTSQAYYNGCMQKRNRVLVDPSSVCVSYQKRQTGGTAYTVRYALNKGVKVINIADKINNLKKAGSIQWGA